MQLLDSFWKDHSLFSKKNDDFLEGVSPQAFSANPIGVLLVPEVVSFHLQCGTLWAGIWGQVAWLYDYSDSRL